MDFTIVNFDKTIQVKENFVVFHLFCFNEFLEALEWKLVGHDWVEVHQLWKHADSIIAVINFVHVHGFVDRQDALSVEANDVP